MFRVQVAVLLLPNLNILPHLGVLVEALEDSVQGLASSHIGRDDEADTFIAHDLLEAPASVQCLLTTVQCEVQKMVRHNLCDCPIHVGLGLTMPDEDKP
eukprot:CAMPEP_0206465670 /NCGR_PEP_ID=MMETSP0324_2-20121206/27979_1 /ASSEMBLY_ACC=CAM_ASM_000836 /TAXON_ID=2866 /ORGANISM="Crypthecodinium cohnii, Strain Seligo" /LENGTH=98 /DNA_ID=CAMNT_0053938595 /DNA_START=1010 /DNA_END=1306 /DNA_ORIENTATION=+